MPIKLRCLFLVPLTKFIGIIPATNGLLFIACKLMKGNYLKLQTKLSVWSRPHWWYSFCLSMWLSVPILHPCSNFFVIFVIRLFS
ncbi:hypothetical protein BDF19DRAFT_285868 [Syncephalis fuscata]|nr:hypothetical protein BDF19DRAFT_285868 [Syncephalis fuscata]